MLNWILLLLQNFGCYRISALAATPLQLFKDLVSSARAGGVSRTFEAQLQGAAAGRGGLEQLLFEQPQATMRQGRKDQRQAAVLVFSGMLPARQRLLAWHATHAAQTAWWCSRRGRLVTMAYSKRQKQASFEYRDSSGRGQTVQD